MAGNSNSGRRAIPINNLVDSGTYRPSRHGALPDSAEGEPTMPRDLDATARAYWRQVVPDLVSRGLAKAVDAGALRQLCELWSLYRKAMKEAQKNPAEMARVVKVYFDAHQALAARFGLTPKDRQKLRMPPKQDSAKVASRERA